MVIKIKYVSLLSILFLAVSIGFFPVSFAAESKDVLFEQAREKAIQSVINDPKNKRVVYDAVWVSSDAFQYADDSLKKDKKFVISIMQQDGKLFTLIDKNLKKDADVLLVVVKELTLASYDTSYRSRFLDRDESFVRYVLKHYVSDVEDEDKRDEKYKQFVIKAVSKDGSSLKFFSYFMDDEDVVLAAVTQTAHSYRYADSGFEDNKKIMKALVSNDGFYLEDVGERLKNDREVVMAAIKNTGASFEFASAELRHDRAFVIAAVSVSGYSYYYASDKLKNDREIALLAVSNEGFMLKDLPSRLAKDKEIVAAAVKSHPNVFKFVDKSLKSDKAFVKSLGVE